MGIETHLQWIGVTYTIVQAIGPDSDYFCS